MRIRIVNGLVFFALVCLIFLSDPLSFAVHFYLTCALLVILTAGVIIDLLYMSNRKTPNASAVVMLVVLGLLAGFLSSWIVGVQTHDERDGGPSFGIALWPLILGIIYPLCFYLFIFGLSFLKHKTIRILLLFLWVACTAVLGYFSDHRTSFENDPRYKDMPYESIYFPSETKMATSIIAATVLVLTIMIIFRKEREPELQQ